MHYIFVYVLNTSGWLALNVILNFTSHLKINKVSFQFFRRVRKIAKSDP